MTPTTTLLNQKKVKTHTRYYDSEGVLVPGITTVIRMKNNPYLVEWSNKLGLDGYEVSKYVDGLADIGVLAHYLVECDVKSLEPDLSDYSPRQIDAARGSFNKWLVWKTKNQFTLIQSEMKLVSNKHKFGGTLDIYGVVNGVKSILEIKTSKSCYPEHKTQAVAQKCLLSENGYEITDCRIIRLGRSENEGFDDILVGAHELHWNVFKACLALYYADKNLQPAAA